MKKIICALTLIAFTGIIVNAETEIKVTTEIEKVTVFLSGAQVHRTGAFGVKKGVSKITFEGISPYINANSIQVKGKGKYIILDVAHKIKYPEPLNNSNTIPKSIQLQIKRMEDSLKSIGYDIEDYGMRRKAYKMELDMLLNSGVIKGQSSSDSIELLQKAMDYMRIKVAEINSELLKIKRSEFELKEIRTSLMSRMKEVKQYNSNSGFIQKQADPIQQIVVTVSATESLSGSMNVSYMVSGASWSPSYDLRATNTASPITLTYKASIRQNTGEDWENVKLTLSSMNPNRSTTKPILPMWYINYFTPIKRPAGSTDFYNGRRSEAEELDDDLSKKLYNIEDGALGEADSQKPIVPVTSEQASNYFQMNESLTNVEFEVSMPFSIESNGQDHLIAVQQSEIPAAYTHYLVPKMDQDAFLVARLTDWEKMNLLPAIANIFYDGTYVGQTRINPAVMSDTIDLALGRDRGIMVKRNKLKQEEKVKNLSSEKIRTLTWELEIRNNKTRPINLVIHDHIPVTQNEDIKVSLLEKSGAIHTETNGKLEWKLGLDAKGQKKLAYVYSVRYNKDKTLAFQ